MVYLLVLVAVLAVVLVAVILTIKKVKQNLANELKWRGYIEDQYTSLVAGVNKAAPQLILDDLLKEGQAIKIRRRKIEE